MVHVRLYRKGDSFEEIAALLNRAYAALSEQGLRFVASWQTPAMTAERIAMGTCFLATEGHRIVGTILLYPTQEDSECEYYRRSGVFHFGKFAVTPERQGEGIGRALHEAIEAEARQQGATELACDTAEPACHLIDMYLRWGYEIIARQDWSVTNYESLVLAKRL